MKKFFDKIGLKKDGHHHPKPSSQAAGPTENIQGYDIRDKELTKIHKAAWNGDLAKVKNFAKKDPNSPDKEFRTPLHLACVAGHADVVQELLEWNAKTNVGDGHAKTPLMKATECNQEECVKLLLEHRAEVDAIETEGNTGLHLAVKHGFLNIAVALISAGANLNLKNKEGQTPLHLSVISGKREDISRLLLEHKADPNLVDRVMRTPLHYACDIDSINQVKQLLEKGANTSMKDAKGWTADDCAVMKANHACSQLVYDHILQQRKYTHMGASVPNTPRSGAGSLPPSSQTTPRTATDTSEFGMPAPPVADGSESGDETLSKASASGGDKHTDSWAEDTDVSSAMDDHRKKTGPVKISLTKNINLESDDEQQSPTHGGGPAGASPVPRPGSDSIRTIQTRIPTPDSNRTTPGTPGMTPSPKPGSPGVRGGNQSKIPVKQQLSGASQTSIEDNWSDGEQVQKSARVSFKEEKDVRNISMTDDDTDVEDDEEEEEADPPKKRKIETEPTPAGSSYQPSGMVSSAPKQETAEKMKEEGQTETAFLKSIGMENDVDVDDVSDVSFEDTENDHMTSPRAPVDRDVEENTPRKSGILKNWPADKGKPPSTRKTETDDDESDWDSTKHSETESKHSDAVSTPREPVRPQPKVKVIHGDEEESESDDEVDHEMERSLNPENSLKTSQWDSTEEAYSPRTPRDEAHIRGQDVSVSGGVEFEEEIDDNIEEAVTAFTSSTKPLHKSPAPSYETPEPKSDSTAPRSHGTPEPHTVSGTSSSSVQKTTIIKAVVEEPPSPGPGEEEPPSPRQQEEVELEGDEESEESEWDSEDEQDSSEEAAPVYLPTEPQETRHDSPRDGEPHIAIPQGREVLVGGETPREGETPRGLHTTSTMSEEESVSEWELERQKEKECQRLADLEEEQHRQEEWEEEERRRQEQLAREVEEELRREEMQNDETSSESQDVSDVEYDQMVKVKEEVKDVSEHSYKSPEVSQRSQRSHVSEVMNNSQRSQKSNFAEILSNFQTAEKTHRPESPEAMVESQRSEGSQLSGVKVTSQKSDISEHSHSSHQSPRTWELKKAPPKLVVSQMLKAPMASRNPIKMGEIENESPVPAVEDQIEIVRNVQVHSKPPVEMGIDHMAGGKYDAHEDKFDSDEDIGDIENEEVAEEEIKPVYGQREEISREMIKPVYGQREETFDSNVYGKQDLFMTNGDMDAESKDIRQDLSTPAAPTDSVYDAISTDQLPAPVSSAPKAMSSQSDGNSPEHDVVDIVDSGRLSQHRPASPPFNLPDLSGNTGLYSSGLEVPFDDDGLSVTSTENGDISVRSENLPYGKDMLVNMNLNDSTAVLKLQEHLREHRRQLEHEKGQKMLLENKQKLITKEKNEMQKRIDNLNRQKSVLEQSKLDLESKIRTLEYQMSEEEEKRRNAEHILDKEKEHHVKLEKQLAGEMEARQQAELTMRNIKIDLRTAQNQIKELEEEKEEFQRLLSNERSARELQVKINEEQQRFQQHLHEESLKTSSQKDDSVDDAQRSLELADDDIKHAQDQIEKFRNEALALRSELDRQRLHLTEENTMLTSENEKLQLKVEDLRNEIKLDEEALTQSSLQHSLQLSNAKKEAQMLGTTLEKERVTREKIQSELESVKSRFQGTMSQFEKAQQARNELERRLHDDREEWARQLERKDQELLKHKETVETLLQKLNSTETKLNALENELHIANTTLLERGNQNQQTQRDLQYYKTAQENYDVNYRKEKEQNAKLLGKIESLQDRLTAQQHDNLSLKQQLETALAAASDRSGIELHDKLNTMMTSLKADHEKARGTLEEKNATLQDTISRLKEEVMNVENRRSNLEQDLRRMNQEYNEMVRKLSVSEATLEVALKARESLEQERGQMKLEIEKLQQRYNAAQEKTIESQTKIGELVDKLDKAEQSRNLSNQQLMDTSATMHAFNSTKSDLEEQYQKLQVDNVRVEAELKHEKQKVEMLQRDLVDSQKVRSSLEALCSNLKSTNAHLEEKIGPEQLREVTQSIAQLDRQKQEFAAQLEEEKRKTRKALEQKRLAETKLEAEQNKTGQLQKEVASLKAYLKVAKKKLKDGDSDDNTVETDYTDKAGVEETKKQIEAKYRLELNRKLDEVNNYLEEQARTRQRLDTAREDQESKLRNEKRKLEEECTDLRIRYEQVQAQKETKEIEAKRYRDLYESEMQWRMRLSEQLYRSTDKAFGFKNNAERQRNRMYGSLSNLSMNGHTIDLSRLAEDPLSNKLKAELDRSIAKHLEAAPHDQIKPLVRTDDPFIASSNFAKSNAEYMELLKRKYCV